MNRFVQDVKTSFYIDIHRKMLAVLCAEEEEEKIEVGRWEQEDVEQLCFRGLGDREGCQQEGLGNPNPCNQNRKPQSLNPKS